MILRSKTRELRALHPREISSVHHLRRLPCLQNQVLITQLITGLAVTPALPLRCCLMMPHLQMVRIPLGLRYPNQPQPQGPCGFLFRPYHGELTPHPFSLLAIIQLLLNRLDMILQGTSAVNSVMPPVQQQTLLVPPHPPTPIITGQTFPAPKFLFLTVHMSC